MDRRYRIKKATGLLLVLALFVTAACSGVTSTPSSQATTQTTLTPTKYTGTSQVNTPKKGTAQGCPSTKWDWIDPKNHKFGVYSALNCLGTVYIFELIVSGQEVIVICFPAKEGGHALELQNSVFISETQPPTNTGEEDVIFIFNSPQGAVVVADTPYPDAPLGFIASSRGKVAISYDSHPPPNRVVHITIYLQDGTYAPPYEAN